MSRWVVYVTVFAALLIGAFVVDRIFGWNTIGIMAGSGAGLGAWLGIRAGNKRAKETDAYRAQWLSKRAGYHSKDAGSDDGRL